MAVSPTQFHIKCVSRDLFPKLKLQECEFGSSHPRNCEVKNVSLTWLNLTKLT